MNEEISDRATTKGRPLGTSRSPNYPQMNITQAIERIKKVYAAEHTHSVPDQSIASALGYSSLNGTSKVVLSALKKFGLLMPSGEGFKISQDAVAIIELLPDDPTRIVALHKAALRPPVFKQLNERYGTDLPSDASLRHYLVGLGFESDAANQVIRFYKETMAFLDTQGPAKDTGPEIEPEAETDKRMPTNNASSSNAAERLNAPQYTTAPSASQFRFQVSVDCFAEVSFTAQITQEAIRKLISYLELTMDVYPSQARLRQIGHDSAGLNEHGYTDEDDQE